MDKEEKGFIFTFDSTLALLVTAIIITGIGQVGAREIMGGGYGEVQFREYTDDAFKVLDRGGYLGEALDVVEEGSENYSKAEEILENGLEEAIPEDLVYELNFPKRPINVSSYEGIEWENKTHVTTTFLANLPPTENHIRILTMAPDGKDVSFTERIKEERPFWGIKTIGVKTSADEDKYPTKNETHVNNGRAFFDNYEDYNLYYAMGSEEYLGTGKDNETTLIKFDENYYVDGENYAVDNTKDVFFYTLRKEWENFDVVFIPGATETTIYEFDKNERETLTDFAENGRLVLGGYPLFKNQEHDNFLENFGIEHPTGVDIEKESAQWVDSTLPDSGVDTEFAMYVRPIRIWYDGPPTETYLHPVIDGFTPLHLLRYPDGEPVYFYDDYGDTVTADDNQDYVTLLPHPTNLHKDVTGGDNTIYYNQDTARVLTNWGRAPDGQILDLNGLIVNDPPETEGSTVYIPANFVEASNYGKGSDYEWLRLAMNAISGEGLGFSSERVQITIGIREGG